MIKRRFKCPAIFNSSLFFYSLRSFGLFLSLVFTAISVWANNTTILLDDDELARLSQLSPLPAPRPDISNKVADDPHAIDFGEALFFDKRLSDNGDLACASCHKPELGWTDGKAVFDESLKFPRNVPTLWNVAYNRWYNWDGSADSAWSQMIGPLESTVELNFDRVRLVRLIASDKAYQIWYEALFNDPLPDVSDTHRFPPAAKPLPKDYTNPLNLAWYQMAETDRLEVNQVLSNVGKAIAAFERTLISNNSRFDEFVAEIESHGSSTLLTHAEQRGFRLFIGKGRCVLCHSGPNLSDGEFHDLGFAILPGWRVDPGRYVGIEKVLKSPFNRIGNFADQADPYAPVKYLSTTGRKLAEFKTPTLRELAHTAPYMHDGRVKTLEEVVEYYSERKNSRPLSHGGELANPVKFSEEEKSDVVAFLKTLSSENPAITLTQKISD